MKVKIISWLSIWHRCQKHLACYETFFSLFVEEIEVLILWTSLQIWWHIIHFLFFPFFHSIEFLLLFMSGWFRNSFGCLAWNQYISDFNFDICNLSSDLASMLLDLVSKHSSKTYSIMAENKTMQVVIRIEHLFAPF